MMDTMTDYVSITYRVFWYTYISFMCIYELWLQSELPDKMWAVMIVVWLFIAAYYHLEWALVEINVYSKTLKKDRK